MLHGFGTLIYRGVSKLEATNGPNFVLECLYKSIIYYLEAKREADPGHHIRKIYIQLDNAKGNKCWTFFAGAAALLAYGVVSKVKISFGLANHNHTDIDAGIGNVVGRIANMNLPTMDLFEAACIESMQSKENPVLACSEITCIPDYISLYSDFNAGNISGIEEIHHLRMECIQEDPRLSGAENIRVNYKEDLRNCGYQPRSDCLNIPIVFAYIINAFSCSAQCTKGN
jgi:hypothetical protein